MSTEHYSTGEVPKVGDYVRISPEGRLIWQVNKVNANRIVVTSNYGSVAEVLISPCIKLDPSPLKPYVVCAACQNKTRLTPCPACNPKGKAEPDFYDLWKRFYKETKPIVQRIEDIYNPSLIPTSIEIPFDLKEEIRPFLIKLRDTTNSRSEHEKLIQLIEKLK